MSTELTEVEKSKLEKFTKNRCSVCGDDNPDEKTVALCDSELRIGEKQGAVHFFCQNCYDTAKRSLRVFFKKSAPKCQICQKSILTFEEKIISLRKPSKIPSFPETPVEPHSLPPFALDDDVRITGYRQLGGKTKKKNKKRRRPKSRKQKRKPRTKR